MQSFLQISSTKKQSNAKERNVKLINFLLLTSFLAPSLTFGQPQYHAMEDEFGDGTIHAVIFESSKNSIPAALVIQCDGTATSTSISLQPTNHTIFPDKTTPNNEYMTVLTKYKFDTAPKAVEENWIMRMLKYDAAYKGGDSGPFIRNAIKANTLSLKHIKRADIYRFSLAGSAQPLKKLANACNISI